MLLEAGGICRVLKSPSVCDGRAEGLFFARPTENAWQQTIAAESISPSMN